MNVLSGVRLARQYFPLMLKQDWGRIIFISSESALQIPAEMLHYGTTKTAQLAVARGLAELTKGTAVTVNSVLPGPTASGGSNGFLEKISGDKSPGRPRRHFSATCGPLPAATLHHARRNRQHGGLPMQPAGGGY
ncbi:MAG: SDR family oxidoreductase [Hymenobacter sp.]